MQLLIDIEHVEHGVWQPWQDPFIKKAVGSRHDKQKIIL